MKTRFFTLIMMVLGLTAQVSANESNPSDDLVEQQLEQVKSLSAEMECSTGMAGIDIQLYLEQGSIFWKQDPNSEAGSWVAGYDVSRLRSDIETSSLAYKDTLFFAGHSTSQMPTTEFAIAWKTHANKSGEIQGYLRGHFVECKITFN